MSGGIAYVLDRHDQFTSRCNLETFELEAVSAADDVAELRQMIEAHQSYTGSSIAADILADWDNAIRLFKKVMPTDYKRVLLEAADKAA